MNHNFDEFLIVLNTTNPPFVFALTEMWPNDDIERGLILMENFCRIRMTKRLRRCGGVATLVSKNSEMELLKEMKIDKMQIQTIVSKSTKSVPGTYNTIQTTIN